MSIGKAVLVCSGNLEGYILFGDGGTSDTFFSKKGACEAITEALSQNRVTAEEVSRLLQHVTGSSLPNLEVTSVVEEPNYLDIGNLN